MILCLVGTNPYDFTRLVKAIDTMAPKINIPIVIQIGNTEYKPKNCEFFSFKAKDEVGELISQSELVISQGGYGSMTDAIMLNKKLIGVPRKIEFKESQDNQVELVEYYESKGYLKACYEIEKLESLVLDTLNNKFVFKKYIRETNVTVGSIIKDFLNEI